MEHNAVYLTLPIEIHHKYVQYIDLRDLGALIFTCKELYELFGNDLQLQKIVYEHTEQRVLHNKMRRPIKQLFMENRAFYAVKIDDIEFLKYTLPSLSYRDLEVKLRPFSTDPKVLLVTKPSTKKKKAANDKNLLQKIFDYDASKCLDFLLEAFLSDWIRVNEDNDPSYYRNKIIFQTMLLIAISCFKPLRALGSPLNLPYQKVLRVFLKHCLNWKDLIIWGLVKKISIERPNGKTLYSKMVFESLMACSKAFPEFQIDLGQPNPLIAQSMPGFCTINTLLEYVAASSLVHSNPTNSDATGGTFKYFMDHGAPFDPKAPYLPLTLKPAWFSTFSLFLEKMGSNINALMQPANQTLLHSILVTGQRYDRAFEYLLYRGAKLTKEEEAHWLNIDPTSILYKVAVCQQTVGYSPLKNIEQVADKNFRLDN